MDMRCFDSPCAGSELTLMAAPCGSCPPDGAAKPGAPSGNALLTEKEKRNGAIAEPGNK